jgi:hypothetical protein
LRQRAIDHLRGNVIGYLALFLAVGAGGGYALAASRSSSIHGCVVKRTGELLVKSRCGRGQTKLVWNQVGPSGATGATGPAGPAPPSAWAVVSNTGQAGPTDGISAQRLSAGTYQITVTAPACSDKFNAPAVTVSDANPPNGQTAGAFPVAWVADTGIGPFTVYTGVVVMGVFTPTDHTFNVQDVCG